MDEDGQYVDVNNATYSPDYSDYGDYSDPGDSYDYSDFGDDW